MAKLKTKVRQAADYGLDLVTLYSRVSLRKT